MDQNASPIPRRTALVLVVCAACALVASTGSARELARDPYTGRATFAEPIPMAASPNAVRADSPDDRYVYVATDAFGLGAYAVDRDGGLRFVEAYRPFRSGERPLDLIVSPDGRFLYALSHPDEAPDRTLRLTTLTRDQTDGRLLSGSGHDLRFRAIGSGGAAAARLSISRDGDRIHVSGGSAVGGDPVGLTAFDMSVFGVPTPVRLDRAIAVRGTRTGTPSAVREFRERSGPTRGIDPFSPTLRP